MAPKRSAPPPAVRGPPRSNQPNMLTATYRFVTSSENASLVRSVAIFGVAVAFLHSSWAEALVPVYVLLWWCQLNSLCDS